MCERELEDFWSGNHCIEMTDPAIEICDEDGISVFLGKCVEANGFKVCPLKPVIYEHLEKTDKENYH